MRAEWIDVNDRLPTRMQDVLAFTGTIHVIAHYEPGWGRWLDDDDRDVSVTHWMPLPAPPAPRRASKPEYRNCRDCEFWKSGGKSDGTIIRVCINPRAGSDKFMSTTTADDGCTPHKKARADWI